MGLPAGTMSTTEPSTPAPSARFLRGYDKGYSAARQPPVAGLTPYEQGYLAGVEAAEESPRRSTPLPDLQRTKAPPKCGKGGALSLRHEGYDIGYGMGLRPGVDGMDPHEQGYLDRHR